MMALEALTLPSGFVALDFDGTLFPPGGPVNSRDLLALSEARRRGLVCVLVTGRSRASLESVMTEALMAELDYGLLSCGAVCWDVKGDRYLELHSFDRDEARRVEAVLREMRLDFSRHLQAPDNHRFGVLRLSGLDNSDLACLEFHARRRAWLEPWREEAAGAVGQFIAVLPSGGESMHRRLRKALPGCSVIRATSPIDHRSTWLEVFPAQVSKGAACDRLCARLGLGAEQALAIGNDHNDEDMLAWAGRACVVAGAPEELRSRYETVAACEEGGVAEALEGWSPPGA